MGAGRCRAAAGPSPEGRPLSPDADPGPSAEGSAGFLPWYRKVESAVAFPRPSSWYIPLSAQLVRIGYMGEFESTGFGIDPLGDVEVQRALALARARESYPAVPRETLLGYCEAAWA